MITSEKSQKVSALDAQTCSSLWTFGNTKLTGLLKNYLTCLKSIKHLKVYDSATVKRTGTIRSEESKTGY